MTRQFAIEVPPQRIPLTVENVMLLQNGGAFDDYGKVELIDGELLYMNAQFRRHMVLKSELAYRIRRALEAIGNPLFVGTEGSVALSDHDLPQPDILLTSAPEGDGAIPGASIALLIEVADATLPFDLGRKARMYAAAGMPEYWVVDVQGAVIHQLWSPAGCEFGERRTIRFGEPVSAITIGGLVVDTAKL